MSIVEFPIDPGDIQPNLIIRQGTHLSRFAVDDGYTFWVAIEPGCHLSSGQGK